jgi:hypothetical protein
MVTAIKRTNGSDAVAVRERQKRDVDRVEVALPRDLVERVDAAVGPESRGRFIADAVEDRLQQGAVAEAERQRRIAAAMAALSSVAGSLEDVDIPGWETSESAAEWVHRLRHDPGFLSTPPIDDPDRE